MNMLNDKKETNRNFRHFERRADGAGCMPKRPVPPFCSSCGRDLTVVDKGSEGLLDDGGVAIRMANILSSAEHNNIILTGEAGTGKSASVKLLGRRVAEGKVRELSGKRIFEISIDLLFNNCYAAHDKGEKLRILFQEAEENDIILFIDEGHRIYGFGESNSIGNIIKPYITSGRIRLILATTNVEYDEFIGRDAALARRFERLRLSEPNAKRTCEIIRSVFSARYPELTISDVVISRMVELSARYIRDERYNPDKSLSVLDYTAAWLKNSGESKVITEDTVKQALAEKLGIPRERFEQNMTCNIRTLEQKLASEFSVWGDAVSELSQKLSSALTRRLRNKGPLCSAAVAGSDMGLLRDVAFCAATSMGFDKAEITQVSPTDGAEKLVWPFVRNPNGAVIVEIRKDSVCGESEILGALTMILTEGRIRGRYGDVLYSKVPVLILFEGEMEKGGGIGFARNETTGRIRLTDDQESLLRLWFREERPVCFGGIRREDAAVLYECRFLPMLERQIELAGAPKITIEESAKEYITERLASPDCWSAAPAIISDLIRRAMLGEAAEYTAYCRGDGITLHNAGSLDDDILEVG